MYLRGDFQSNAAATQAIRQLRASGFDSDAVDVFSDEPVEFPRGTLERPSRMSFIVVSGAVFACLLAIAFVYFTQYNYPLVTGGIPLFSFWATGVIFYELTMLGAIVTTLICFLGESGLLRKKRSPVPDIEPGIICIRVVCSQDQLEDARRCMERAGADRVTRLPEAS